MGSQFWRSRCELACDHHEGVLLVTCEFGVRITGGANCTLLLTFSNSQASGVFISEEDQRMPHMLTLVLMRPQPPEAGFHLESGDWERLPRIHHVCLRGHHQC